MEGSEKTQDKQAVDGLKEEVKVEAASAAQESAEEGCSCLGRVGRLLPPKYWDELRQLIHLAGPVVRLGTHTTDGNKRLFTENVFPFFFFFLMFSSGIILLIRVRARVCDVVIVLVRHIPTRQFLAGHNRYFTHLWSPRIAESTLAFTTTIIRAGNLNKNCLCPPSIRAGLFVVK